MVQNKLEGSFCMTAIGSDLIDALDCTDTRLKIRNRAGPGFRVRAHAHDPSNENIFNLLCCGVPTPPRK